MENTRVLQEIGRENRSFPVASARRNRRGRYTDLGLANLNKFSRLWDIGTVPSCLVSDPGMIRAGGWWPRVCKLDK